MTKIIDRNGLTGYQVLKFSELVLMANNEQLSAMADFMNKEIIKRGL